MGERFGPEDRAAFFRTMLELGLYQTVRLVNISSEYLSNKLAVARASAMDRRRSLL
jgi:hypothetical protein